MPLKQLTITFCRRFKLVLWCLKYFVLFLTIFFIFKQLFSISSIEIIGTSHLTGTSSFKKKFIFFISVKKLENQLYELNPHIKSIKINKYYPNKLEITVEENETIALLKADEGYFYLNSDGRILQKNKTINDKFPVINYYQKFHLEQFNIGEIFNNKDILFSLFFIKKISPLGIKINTVDINNVDMLIFKTDNKTYLLTTSKDENLQFQQLKTLVKRFKIDRTDYESIDLRFDKPIIKLKIS